MSAPFSFALNVSDRTEAVVTALPARLGSPVIARFPADLFPVINANTFFSSSLLTDSRIPAFSIGFPSRWGWCAFFRIPGRKPSRRQVQDELDVDRDRNRFEELRDETSNGLLCWMHMWFLIATLATSPCPERELGRNQGHRTGLDRSGRERRYRHYHECGHGISIVSATNSAGSTTRLRSPSALIPSPFAKTGFKELLRKGITLQIQTIAVDATLQVGNTMEQVTVIAEVPASRRKRPINTSTSARKRCWTLLIVGGIWFSELTKVLPGVGGVEMSPAEEMPPAVRCSSQWNSSEYSQLSDRWYDRHDPRDVNASNNYPPIDSIAEVSINTANGGAQTGIACWL